MSEHGTRRPTLRAHDEASMEDEEDIVPCEHYCCEECSLRRRRHRAARRREMAAQAAARMARQATEAME